MSFFSRLFGHKPKNQTELPEIKENDFLDNSDPSTNNLVTIEYGTGLPIDAVYAFLKRNYEDDGFADAMCNIDASYKESKINIIKNELKLIFKQINLRYNNDLKKLNSHISLIEEQGMINTARDLKAQKETYMDHLAEIKKMEEDFDNNQLNISVVESYNRGFKRGLAAKTEDYINGK